MASTDDHCLLDLLWRNRRGELALSVVMVIANHPDLADQMSIWWCWRATCRSWLRVFSTRWAAR
jgi:hypothetical protein